MKQYATFIFLLFWVTMFCGLVPAQTIHSPRVWTSVSGQQIEATYQSFDGTFVRLLLPDGEIIGIQRAKLSSADQAYLAQVMPEFRPRSLGNPTVTFFGESIRTRSICVCMDISASMKTKGNPRDYIKEIEDALSQLNAGIQFNIIVYVDGSLAFSQTMLPANENNRTAAIAWLNQPFDSRAGNKSGSSAGTPHEALTKAFELKADTVVLVTDNLPYYQNSVYEPAIESHPKDLMRLVSSAASIAGHPVKIYPVLFKPHQNRRGREAVDYYKRWHLPREGSASSGLKAGKYPTIINR